MTTTCHGERTADATLPAGAGAAMAHAPARRTPNAPHPCRTALVVAAGLLTMAAPPASQACKLPRQAVVTQSARLNLDGRTFTVGALSLPDRSDGDDRSRLLVLDGRCKPVWSDLVDGLESRFEARTLGGTDLLVFVTMQVHGDGTGYVHRVLALGPGAPRLLLPPIAQTGKDGFHLGPLGAGLGDGIVTWTADPSGESEADAHPYVVEQWRWRGGRLTGHSSRETTRRFMPSNDQVPRSDVVARQLGLPYRDQTGTAEFMDPARVYELKAALDASSSGGR